MRIRFWGVRGSIAAPGKETAFYGGNTSCVELALSDGTALVLDAGTGLRPLGLDMRRRPRPWPVHILLSHHHWDHIQGFPFFVPIYDPKAKLKVYPFREGGRGVLFSLLEQMDGAHFPVASGQLPSTIEVVEPQGPEFRVGPARVRRLANNHPGGSWAFRVEDGELSVVYMTDNELDPPARATAMEDIVAFCRGADLLVHDAQYTPEDLKLKRGWGHSSVPQAAALALAAGVRRLVLFHHEPERADSEVARLEAEAAAWLAARGGPKCLAAFEGLELDLRPGSRPGGAGRGAAASARGDG